MTALIESVAAGVPAALTEIITLRRTLKKRAEDVLAYFDRPGTSNGPTEPINGRLEHPRGSALGFRNLTNYIVRSLLSTAGSDHDHNLDCDRPVMVPCSVHAGSARSSPNRTIRGTTASAAAAPAAASSHRTPSATRSGTSSNAPSTCSSKGEPWPPATTSSPSPTAAASSYAPSPSGYASKETRPSPAAAFARITGYPRIAHMSAELVNCMTRLRRSSDNILVATFWSRRSGYRGGHGRHSSCRARQRQPACHRALRRHHPDHVRRSGPRDYSSHRPGCHRIHPHCGRTRARRVPSRGGCRLTGRMGVPVGIN